MDSYPTRGSELNGTFPRSNSGAESIVPSHVNNGWVQNKRNVLKCKIAFTYLRFTDNETFCFTNLIE